MSNYETILVEKRGAVAVLTINRPDKLNALNSKVHSEGVAALNELRTDDEVRVVVITGAGEKSFVAGRGYFGICRSNCRHAAQYFSRKNAF